MNIFLLDEDIGLNARYHCDKHIVKMPLESAQLLCGVQQHFGKPAPYKLGKAHMKHPCFLWLLKSRQNYEYLVELGLALCEEYTYRYDKTHASQDVIEQMALPGELPNAGLTPFARAFNKSLPKDILDKMHTMPSAIEAYRLYYNVDKARFAKWKNRPTPNWFKPL